MTISLTGNTRKRLTEAVRFSETARARAAEIRAEIRERETHRLVARHTDAEMTAPTSANVDVLVDVQAAQTPRFKVAIADEQWGNRTAQLYAQLLLVEQSDHIIRQNDKIIHLLQDVVFEDRPNPP